MLRRLTPDDFDIFGEIRAEAIRLHPESFGSPDEEESPEKGKAAHLRWLSGDLWGAFENGKLVGTTGFFIQPGKRMQHRGTLYFFYVREACRGKGIGDQLIKTAMTSAETRVDQVHLCVNVTSTAAIKAYQRNGMAPIRACFVSAASTMMNI